MDAVTAIMNDHRTLEKLFAALRVGDGDPAAVLTEIEARLHAHSVAEEDHVYPALVRENPREAGQVHHGVKEHREVEERLATARRALGTPGFGKACTEFVHAVTHHVEEEETEILPALRDESSSAELEELGRAFEERRLAELVKAGYTDQNSAGDDLYNEARDAGHSDMNTELPREALERRSG